MKFSEIFPDVFYFTTGNPRDFTSRTAQPKGDLCIASRRAAAQEWNKRMLTVIETISYSNESERKEVSEQRHSLLELGQYSKDRNPFH